MRSCQRSCRRLPRSDQVPGGIGEPAPSGHRRRDHAGGPRSRRVVALGSRPRRGRSGGLPGSAGGRGRRDQRGRGGGCDSDDVRPTPERTPGCGVRGLQPSRRRPTRCVRLPTPATCWTRWSGWRSAWASPTTWSRTTEPASEPGPSGSPYGSRSPDLHPGASHRRERAQMDGQSAVPPFVWDFSPGRGFGVPGTDRLRTNRGA